LHSQSFNAVAGTCRHTHGKAARGPAPKILCRIYNTTVHFGSVLRFCLSLENGI